MNPLPLLRAYPSSTILGLSVIATTATAFVLEQITWRQALAGLIGGLLSVVMKQLQGGTVVVPGGPNTIEAQNVSVEPKPGSTTLIETPLEKTS